MTVFALVLSSVALVLSVAGLVGAVRQLHAAERRMVGERCGCKSCRRVKAAT